MNRGRLLSYMTYCGEHWGVVGTGGTFTPKMYRLQLQQLKDKRFEFTEVSDAQNAEQVWGRHPGYKNKQFLMLKYMGDKDKLFGVQCMQEHGKSLVRSDSAPEIRICGAKCGVYDLVSNQWKMTSPFRKNTFSEDDEDNFKCGLCYAQCYGERIYLVSSLGRTAKYDFGKNGWSVLYEAVGAHDLSMRFDVGPIVWSYNYSPHILYCVGGKVKPVARCNDAGMYELMYKQFDVRADSRKWIDASGDIEQFKDIDFYSMFQ